MPLHDWSRVDSGLFHAFHLQWIVALTDSLNGGGLPDGYYALPVRKSLRHWDTENYTEEEAYARKACHVAIHDSNQTVVSVVEIERAKPIRILVTFYDDSSSPSTIVEPARTGAALPAVSLHLKADTSAKLPLDETYQTAWHSFPRQLKSLLE